MAERRKSGKEEMAAKADRIFLETAKKAERAWYLLLAETVVQMLRERDTISREGLIRELEKIAASGSEHSPMKQAARGAITRLRGGDSSPS